MPAPTAAASARSGSSHRPRRVPALPAAAAAPRRTASGSSSSAGITSAARSPANGSSASGNTTPSADPPIAAAYTEPARSVPAAKAIAVTRPAKKNGTAQAR